MTLPTVKRRLPENEHWEVVPGITCVRLTRGKCALINTEHWPLLCGYRWYTHRDPSGKRWYAEAYSGKRNCTVKMHRLILGTPSHLDVDHIDGNGLNNSSIFGALNIRSVTTRVNTQNLHIDKTSKYPGVYWRKDRTCWQAQVTFEGLHKNLGHFSSESEAYQKYQLACAQIENGTFAILKRPTYSGHKGVSFNHKSRLWYAYIIESGRMKNLGLHKTLDEALEARRSAENGTFVHKVKPKSSQFKNVSWIKARSRWMASVRINGKSKTIGYFRTEQEAFSARQKFVAAM